MVDNYLHSDITEKIIKAFYMVYNKLGYGFLEKVYERAMIIELKNEGFRCTQQKSIQVFYDSVQIGFYIADIVVEDKIIIEVKAAEILSEAHEAQLTNYLKATDIEVGILLNFGKKPSFKRKVFSSQFKA